MFVELVIVSVIILIFSKGINISLLDGLKGQSLLIALFISMLVSLFFKFRAIQFLNILIYFLLLVFLFINKDNKGFKLIFLGSLFNFLAIALNGGLMPVSEGALIKIGDMEALSILKSGLSQTHSLINETSLLSFFGDVIPIPPPYPLAKLISLGDILIFIGFIYFLLTKSKEGVGK